MAAEKRAKSENTKAAAAKRQKTETAKQLIAELSEKLNAATEGARRIELSVLKETTLVNRKYWPELKAIYLKRDALIAQEKNLWGSIICSHPQIEEDFFVSPVEVSFVCSHLEKVELEDYLDDNGSYEIKFTFGGDASNFVEPTEWVKRVILEDDCETIDEEKSTCTKMKFKSADMDPLKGVAEMRKACSEDMGAEDGGVEDMPIYSLATWFSEVKPALAGEFGEVFRKVVYVSPEIAIASALNDAAEEESSTSGDDVEPEVEN